MAAHASRVEALGYDGLHVAETVHDALALSLLVAEHTERITIRTSVALAFPRSPTLTAYAAWDLAKYSGGRFQLGLGTQIRQNIEGRYGVPWSDPVARMRDYLGALRALFECFANGGPLSFDSPHYRLDRMQPYFNPGPDPGRDAAAPVAGRGERRDLHRWPGSWRRDSSPTPPTPTPATSSRCAVRRSTRAPGGRDATRGSSSSSSASKW